MAIITLDFETFYSADFTLKKIATEEYIRDKQFEVIGVSIAVGNDAPLWHTGAAVAPALQAIDWSRHSMLCYNTAFDGAIAAWHYGCHPALYLDAMGMARSCGLMSELGGTLAIVAKKLGVGQKMDYIFNTIGKRLSQFSSEDLYHFGEYCKNDVELTRAIYKKLKPWFPDEEIFVQDQMLRMFIEPALMFDTKALLDHYKDVVRKKWDGLTKVAKLLNLEYAEQPLPLDDDVLRAYDLLSDGEIMKGIKKSLMSNQQFAKILEGLGVDPPMKLSKTTGEMTYAFAKTDPEFVELFNHDDSTVQTVVATRLGIKSTIEETRAQRFLDIATRGPWPVQYNYWGAHARFSGSGKANPQNLKRGGKLRTAILPPPGHTLVTGDLRQIECRLVNYLAGQSDIIDLFRAFDKGTGVDLYCLAASNIYGRPITADNKHERTVGKISELSLGYGGGKSAYKDMLFAQTGIQMPLHECQTIVDIYRTTHPEVRKLWYRGDDALAALLEGRRFELGVLGCLDGSRPDVGIGLPNGTFLRLPELKCTLNDKGQRQYTYFHARKQTDIYGSMFIALCIQALARIIMTQAMLRIARRYPARLMTHDELGYAIVTADVESAKDLIRTEMSRPVPWAPDLPIAVEVKSGINYGDAKP